MHTIDEDPGVRRTPSLSNTDLLALRHLLRSAGPEVHVIHRVFRREVCAWCFRYEHGRNWHLRLELGDGAVTGMVFCCDGCRDGWKTEYGLDGLQAYAAVEELFRQTRRKDQSADNKDEPADEAREPSEQEVDDAWMNVNERAERIRAYRLNSSRSHEPLSTPRQVQTVAGRKLEKKLQRQAVAEALKLPTSDTISFLLSGVLCSRSSRWADFLSLNPSQPYSSLSLLQETMCAYLQLLAVLPISFLQPRKLSRPVLEAILSRDRGNSFGIWSKPPEIDDEDPEMLGYGTWVCSSFFNHSCEPSIKKRRQGREWVFTAARDIAVDEECCISYIQGGEDNLDVEARRRRLQDGWGFRCACVKCVHEESQMIV